LLSVSLNALSVLNLIMCVGISVEFCIHVTARFLFTRAPSRTLRAAHALYTVGTSVVEGITLTKVTGIAVLSFATSAVFDIYYTRMYAAIVVLGALHGLMWLPVLLSVVGSEESAESTGTCGGWMWGLPWKGGRRWNKPEEDEWVVVGEDGDEEEEQEEEEEVEEEEENKREKALPIVGRDGITVFSAADVMIDDRQQGLLEEEQQARVQRHWSAPT